MVENHAVHNVKKQLFCNVQICYCVFCEIWYNINENKLQRVSVATTQAWFVALFARQGAEICVKVNVEVAKSKVELVAMAYCHTL